MGILEPCTVSPGEREAFRHATGAQVREAVRSGRWRGITQGLALGYVQANLAIVREEVAFELVRFCLRNPKPCPLIDVTDPGNPEPVMAAPGGDVRTDLSRYRVYRNGELVDEVGDLKGIWRNDHVALLIGCSLSLDQALLDADIPMRHLTLQDGRNAVYVSGVQCRPAGRLHGPMVISMRPIRRDLVLRTIEVSSRYPVGHGAPLHFGDPSSIGIPDLAKPQWGKFHPLAEDEVPVFWGCGITPQSIAIASKVPEMITHTAGHMFVTDLKLNGSLAA
jgi:uncharacterized protein YcsI (UPF0317 family)